MGVGGWVKYAMGIKEYSYHDEKNKINISEQNKNQPQKKKKKLPRDIRHSGKKKQNRKLPYSCYLFLVILQWSKL